MNVDPNVMKQQEEEGGLRRKSYPRREPELHFQPAFEQETEYDSDRREPGYQSPYPDNRQHQDSGAVYKPLGRDDRPSFPGGPYESQVISWKKQFGEVYLVDINGEDQFVIRPLSRFEFKQIVGIPNTDPLMREEIICETCTLWPEGLSFHEMSAGKAGIPPKLSEKILEKSAFTQNVSVRPL